MGCFGPTSALESIIRSDAEQQRLTEAIRAPTLSEAMKIPPQTFRIGAAAVIILGTIIYLAITGVQADKSYYVTIGELQAMGNKAYTRHLRVAGDVAAQFHRAQRHQRPVRALTEQGHTLQVSYQGD